MNNITLFNKQVGMIIRVNRKKRKLTQQELSDLIGVPRGTLARYERGLNSVPIENFFKICKVLDIDANTCLKDIDL